MKHKFILILIFFYFNSLISISKDTIIVDHQKITEFEQLDLYAIQKASELKLIFRHASVGAQINLGLDCVQGTRTNPKDCQNFPPYKYDRRNWVFQARGNTGWRGKIEDFILTVESQIDSFDIFSFKFCYLDGLDEVAEPCGKPYSEEKTEQNWQLLRNAYETLEQKYPSKVFIWWTIPLTQVGQFCTEQMNKRIREYCWSNGKILFDLADIQSWDSLGNHTVNAQGWEIAFKGYCGEQNPDAKSCHPNWPGSIRIAKAFWYLMSEISKNYLSVNTDNSYFISKTRLSNLTSSFFDLNLLFEIQIYNILGCLVFHKRNDHSNNLVLPNLPQGLYFIKISTPNKNFIYYTFID